MAGERGYLGAIRGAQHRRRPHDRLRAAGLAAHLHRRDPADRGGRARATRCCGRPMPDLPPLVSGPGDWAAAGADDRRRRSPRWWSSTAWRRCSASAPSGYGMALVFVLQGAPDLALTQVCVDTIGAVVFVLVLRHLPAWFSERPTQRRPDQPHRRVGRWSGVFVFVVHPDRRRRRGSTRRSPTEFIDEAFAEGGGRNVVNVVLVDIRGFDTMGEITVLAVAAMGVYALARLSRRESGVERVVQPAAGGIGERRRPAMRRSLILDVVVRLVFHSALLLGAVPAVHRPQPARRRVRRRAGGRRRHLAALRGRRHRRGARPRCPCGRGPCSAPAWPRPRCTAPRPAARSAAS